MGGYYLFRGHKKCWEKGTSIQKKEIAQGTLNREHDKGFGCIPLGGKFLTRVFGRESGVVKRKTTSADHINTDLGGR